ncbi:MAG TPA: DNA methyltransferase, partial [Rubrobacter sp.]|nr:DNA methyltransferase [Rubrobacter sp.]
VPEDVETRCKPGDLWVLGKHRLLCGDSTDVLQVERLMGGEKADMVFTDPPYGLNWSGGTWATNKIYDNVKQWDVLVEQSVIDFILLLSDKVILWGGNYYQVPPSRCWLSWRKSNAMPTMADFELAWTNFDRPSKEFVAACNSEGRREHPTQKPVALAEWCFAEYASDGKSVLDLFLGSGSTLIACEKTARRCFGMEIDPRYCDVILKRWEDFSGQVAVLQPTEDAIVP